MESRDAILQKIRDALTDCPDVELPPMPQLWPDSGMSQDELIDRFRAELDLLEGELVVCDDKTTAKTKLTGLLDEIGTDRLGAIDSPLVRELLDETLQAKIEWGTPEKTPVELERLAASIVPADYLVADTGSCMITCPTVHDRLMCYLPPVSIVIASKESVLEHLQAIWADVAERVENPQLRGEFVLITGPSRTADIEKILVLGVHGPKRLVVLLV